MFYHQLGQIIPGTLIYLGLAGGLGVTATPAMMAFIDKAEHTSLIYAQNALNSSLKINHLMAKWDPSHKMIIEGEEVKLKHGYPVAKINELERLTSFGTQTLVENGTDSVTIWSMYKSYCFVYQEARNTENTKSPAKISDISTVNDGVCRS